jgi:hypothetical protein
MTSGSSGFDRGSLPRGASAQWASAYKIIMHHARASSNRLRRSAGRGSGPNRTRPYSQRCAVRVMYAKNVTSGQWRAHGRYVARESATDFPALAARQDHP